MPKATRALLYLVAIGCIAAITYAVVLTARELPKAALSEVERAELEAKEIGLPLVAADLAGKEPLPDEQNAAVPLLAAADWFYARPSLKNSGNEAFRAITKSDIETAERLIKELEPGIKLLEQAASRPEADFRDEWDLGGNLLYPELAPIKQLHRGLAARALLHYRSGDHTRAIDDLEVLVTVPAQISDGRAVIPVLSRIALDNVGAIVAERVVGGANESELKSLSEVLSKRKEVDLQETLRRDFYPMLASLRNVDSPQKQTESNEAYLARARREGYAPAVKNHEAYVLHAKGHTGVYKAFLAGGTAKETMERVAQAENRTAALFRGQLGGAGNPTYKNVIGVWAENEAKYRALGALVDIALQKAQSGSYPESLPGRPIDPFTGNPMRYRVEKGSVLIYSLASDGGDQKGITKSKAKKQTGQENPPYDVGVGLPPILLGEN
jgi:hypothetical protein